MKRLLCWWFGCRLDEFNVCDRCCESEDRYRSGVWPRWTWRLERAWKRWKPWGRCAECGKVFFGYGYNGCCCEEHFNKWIPF